MQSFHTEFSDKEEPPQKRRIFPVCPISALPPGACHRLALPNGNELAIYNVSGEYYATDNSCPHLGAALSDGTVFGHIVECGWHGWRFDIRTGECLTVKERVKTFVVRVEEGFLVVEID
ncbi:MAG TPA: non-heme iron oxygenase ferredoxin subunit [Pyrinomonadaceae bacterium]|nr:non-heme iron oxygenase ferredoxin subunit [Pyrinomonadaceae bacterium]